MKDLMEGQEECSSTQLEKESHTRRGIILQEYHYRLRLR